MKGKILIVEDEKGMNEVLTILLTTEGYSVVSAYRVEEAIQHIETDIFDLVITDIKMPGGSGFDVLRKVKELSPSTMVIMITAYGTEEDTIKALKMGAYDYIHKPFQVEEIKIVIQRALEKKALQKEIQRLKETISKTGRLDEIIGKSPKMLRLMQAIPKIARSDSNVLITGESGSGKELFARAIHNHSLRAKGPFVAINCATIPEGLLESELFGFMKGAFTGATHNKEGLFETARGGTLFLDEIAEMPLSIQAKLLRVIETGTFRRLGGVSDIKADVRIIAATNKDLKKEVSSGRFREDLFFRLNVVPVNIPPLRERKEDIPLLVGHFLKKFNAPNVRVPPETMRILERYHWPGNVRELENLIERLLLLTEKEIILPEDLPVEIRQKTDTSERIPELTEDGINLERLLEDIEISYLKKALELSGGVKTKAAELLGLTFRSFRHRLQKYNLGGEGS